MGFGLKQSLFSKTNGILFFEDSKSLSLKGVDPTTRPNGFLKLSHQV
jgi:hypothetical protein